MKDIVLELKEDAREHLFLEPEQTLQWEAAAEIERLREALRKIAALKDHPGLIADDIADDADAIARAALEEKE